MSRIFLICLIALGLGAIALQNVDLSASENRQNKEAKSVKLDYWADYVEKGAFEKAVKRSDCVFVAWVRVQGKKAQADAYENLKCHVEGRVELDADQILLKGHTYILAADKTDKAHYVVLSAKDLQSNAARKELIRQTGRLLRNKS